MIGSKGINSNRTEEGFIVGEKVDKSIRVYTKTEGIFF